MTSVDLEISEDIALQALIFLSEDNKRLSRFFKITGLNAKNVQDISVLPEFFVAVLDYLLGDESLLLSFCSNKNVDPKAIEPAKIYLESKL